MKLTAKVAVSKKTRQFTQPEKRVCWKFGKEEHQQNDFRDRERTRPAVVDLSTLRSLTPKLACRNTRSGKGGYA